VTVATRRARALLKLLDFENMSPRLWGMMWGRRILRLARCLEKPDWHPISRTVSVARDLCLISAAAAGVVAIDTIATDINDLDALRKIDCRTPDGFLAKA